MLLSADLKRLPTLTPAEFYCPARPSPPWAGQLRDSALNQAGRTVRLDTALPRRAQLVEGCEFPAVLLETLV